MRPMLAGGFALLVLAGCGSGSTAEPVAEQPVSSGAATPGSAAVAPTAVCAHPAGFRVSHPTDWSANTGDVLPACSRFAAEPFAVTEASDVRAADITFTVRAEDELPSRWPDETARSRVDVGGRAAVRLEQVTTPGYYPAGTLITSYVVDLPTEGEALVANTVGLPGADHDRNVEVLDAMLASLVLVTASGI